MDDHLYTGAEKSALLKDFQNGKILRFLGNVKCVSVKLRSNGFHKLATCWLLSLKQHLIFTQCNAMGSMIILHFRDENSKMNKKSSQLSM